MAQQSLIFFEEADTVYLQYKQGRMIQTFRLSEENYVNIAVTLLITREVLENDLIVLKDGHQYRIATGKDTVGIEPIQDFMTGAIEGYQISLVRERKEDEDTTSIVETPDRTGLATG